jgi:hypothetical protein
MQSARAVQDAQEAAYWDIFDDMTAKWDAVLEERKEWLLPPQEVAPRRSSKGAEVLAAAVAKTPLSANGDAAVAGGAGAEEAEGAKGKEKVAAGKAGGSNNSSSA